MFSSLASFLFGSNKNCETNSETTATATVTGETNARDTLNLVDAENLVEVTSLTPSVAESSNREQRAIKRGKNKRNNARQQNKRKGVKNNNAKATSPSPSSTASSQTTNLLTPSDSSDEEFNEDEWFIVEKEDAEEADSPSRTDNEGENVPVIEVVKTNKPIAAAATNSLAQQRRLQHINSHSLYSGPRPQKQRNYLQKTRNNTNNSRSNGLSVSTLSPSRTVNDGRNASGREATADGGITRSLYVASSNDENNIDNTATNGIDVGNKMDESWFVTPPPCFTSIGPINMETSPYENLLIEHPSMSVYHSIKTAQEAAESFIKLDIGVNEMAEKQKVNETTPKKNTQTVQARSSGTGFRLDRQSVAQLKQELMARNVQKIQTKKESKDICRTAIKRANKARDVQSKNHIQRRSDRQHSRVFSNANNNRKSNCC